MNLGEVANKSINFGGPQKSLVKLDVLFPIQINPAKSVTQKILDAVSSVGGNNKIVRRVSLHHHPHRFDKFRCVTPVANRLKVAKK